MASYVNTNVSSLNAQKNLTNATNALNTTYKRLSSGLRINSAKDDAAGLQISDRLTAHINGYNQGNRNANDGIALAQVAEGAMDEITNMMQRIRTLSVQASTGSLTTDDRKAISTEVQELQDEITRISCQSTYSGKQILRGTLGTDSLNASKTIDIHVGSLSGHVISMSFSQDLQSSAVGMSIGKTQLQVSAASLAELAIGQIDCALKTVDTARAKLGAYQNRLESTIRNQSSISENLSDARSRIRDTDYAEEAANLSQQSIIQQAATSMLTQANARPQIALSLLG